MTFQVGDIVQLSGAYAHQRVTKIEEGGSELAPATSIVVTDKSTDGFQILNSSKPTNQRKNLK